VDTFLRLLCGGITAFTSGIFLAFLLLLGVCTKLTPKDPWFISKAWFFLVFGIVVVGIALELYLWKRNCKIEEGVDDA